MRGLMRLLSMLHGVESQANAEMEADEKKEWREKVQPLAPRFVIIADNSHFLSTIR